MFNTSIFKISHLLKFLLVSGVIAVTGCNKLLEIDRPRNTISNEKAFDNDQSAYAALAGLYSLMMDVTGDIPTFSNGGLSPLLAMYADEVNGRADNLNPYDFEFNNSKLTSGNEAVSMIIWEPAYKVIYQANAIIEGVNASVSTSLTDSARKQLVAESKMVRAFCHFYLVNLFGDIPLMVTTDVTVTANLSRTPVVEVYQQIEKDLKDAFADLKDDYSLSGGQKIRPNKWAASALLSRTYLYQQKWEEAVAEATKVINSGKYHTQSPGDVFLSDSDESIWQLKHFNNIQAGLVMQDPKAFVPMYRLNWLPVDLLPIFLDSSFYYSIAPLMLPNYIPTQGLLDAFEPNDQRKTKWVDFNLTPSTAPYFGEALYFPCKYKNMNEDMNSYYSGNYTLLRISEQYLIRAEARAHIGTDLTGAASDINEIRNKNGLANTMAATQTELLDAVMQERRVELMAEMGHRWFDLKRTGKASAVLGAITRKQPWNDNYLLLPIPAGEIQRNPRLRPNPGY